MFQLVDMHMRFINIVRHSLQAEPDIFDFIDRFKYIGNISRWSFRLAHHDRTICQHIFTELYGIYKITSNIQPSDLTVPVLMLCHRMICLQVYIVFQNKLYIALSYKCVRERQIFFELSVVRIIEIGSFRKCSAVFGRY